MEVKRQTCQACGSRDLRNILVREPGHPTIVYVACAQCRELVAMYKLRSYFHHGKGIESYLRNAGAAESESGRDWLAQFEQTKEEALQGFRKALEHLATDDREP